MGALVATLLTLAVQQFESRRAEKKADKRRSEARSEAYKQRVEQRNALVQRIKESKTAPTTLTLAETPDKSRTTLRDLRTDGSNDSLTGLSIQPASGLSI